VFFLVDEIDNCNELYAVMKMNGLDFKNLKESLSAAKKCVRMGEHFTPKSRYF
jgi:hypothetical protein